MKATKALKRLTHIEELLSDVVERFSASDIRENLQSARTAAGRAKDAVKAQASSENKSAPKKVATKKSTVKVPRAKAVKEPPPKARKKQRPTKQDYEA